jgi:ActR/RegA family two-component response regulator/predicted regulator of Ras-like GTPase activity (Roadblock/LC7/MglB family)
MGCTGPEIQGGLVSNQILIVDSDVAFATILKEGIETGGEYEVALVTTALKARNIAAQGHLTMAIVDMVLEGEDSLELLQTLRERHPQLRLMVIPVDSLPAEVISLGIQGTLSKPFFLPDIPSQIEAALSRPVGASPMEDEQMEDEQAEAAVEASGKTGDLPATIVETPAPEALPTLPSEPSSPVPSAEMRAHLASESHRLTNQLRYLSRELNADAVLLTYGTELVAYAGHFGRADAERLAQVVSESWQASARVAAALGREQVRFEQSLHEGEDYLLYSLATATEIVLSVALRSDRPLGMIRYNTKQTAQELEPLLLPR